MKNKIRDAYFKWLYGKIKGDSRSYLLLCQYLDTVPFFWNVPNDGNREQDGLRQREIFLEYFGLDGTISGPVSLFEVMVALCDRIEFNLDDLVQKPRQPRWFEELLRNLEISWAVDDEFEFRLGAKGEIDAAIDKLLYRRYGRSGVGSFFPLKNKPVVNMARVEIWYQMMAYLEENY